MAADREENMTIRAGNRKPKSLGLEISSYCKKQGVNREQGLMPEVVEQDRREQGLGFCGDEFRGVEGGDEAEAKQGRRGEWGEVSGGGW